MKPLPVVSLMLLFTLSLGACATTATTAVTHYAPADGQWARPGSVAWVREVVHRQHGDPAGGAVAGALIGGLIGGSDGGGGGGAILGAIGGALIGASVSQGSSESRVYEVAVRFEDGALETYGYHGHSPFAPGQLVMLTPNGLIGR